MSGSDLITSPATAARMSDAAKSTDHLDAPPSAGWAISATARGTVDGGVHDGCHGRRKAHALARSAGWQPTITMRPTEPPSRASVARTTSGLMVWASTIGGRRRRRCPQRRRRWLLGLDHGQRPRGLAHGDSVDQDEGVVALEQLVGEVDAPDPKSSARTPSGSARPASRLATSTPNHRRRGRRCRCRPRGCGRSCRPPGPPAARFDLLGMEVEVAALPHQLVGRRVVVERDGEVIRRRRPRRPRPRRRSAVEEHVLRVAPSRGAAHSEPCPSSIPSTVTSRSTGPPRRRWPGPTTAARRSRTPGVCGSSVGRRRRLTGCGSGPWRRPSPRGRGRRSGR